MRRNVLWGLGICASVAALAITAGLKPGDLSMAYIHMAIAAASAVGLSLLAKSRLAHEAADPTGGRALALSAGLSNLALVWTWASLALFATYAFVLQWHEWWRFVVVFALLAAACFRIAAMLRQKGPSEASESTIVKLAHGATIVHLGTGVVTVLGLLIDGKMVRFLVPRHQDWAAQNIFFFGALAFAAIGWSALAAARAPRS